LVKRSRIEEAERETVSHSATFRARVHPQEDGSGRSDAEFLQRGSGTPDRESKLSFFGAKGVSIPVAVSVFPDELYQVPRTWADRAYPNLIYFNEVDKGGHFAAWEQPELLPPSSAPRSGRFAR